MNRHIKYIHACPHTCWLAASTHRSTHTLGTAAWHQLYTWGSPACWPQSHGPGSSTQALCPLRTHLPRAYRNPCSRPCPRCQSPGSARMLNNAALSSQLWGLAWLPGCWALVSLPFRHEAQGLHTGTGTRPSSCRSPQPHSGSAGTESYRQELAQWSPSCKSCFSVSPEIFTALLGKSVFGAAAVLWVKPAPFEHHLGPGPAFQPSSLLQPWQCSTSAGALATRMGHQQGPPSFGWTQPQSLQPWGKVEICLYSQP